MTAVAARFSEPRHLAAVGVLLIGAAVGALAGYDPKLAIAAAIGMAFVLIAIGDLAFGVAIFGVLTFLELSPVAGGPAVSFAKLAGLALAISWIAALASDRGRGRLLFSSHPALTASLAFLITWTAISGLWAEDPGETWKSVGRLALNLALVPIVFTAIRKPRHLRWVAGGIAGGAALAAFYGLIVAPSLAGAETSVTAAGDLNRVAGTVGDPNLLASVLVVGLVMSMALCLDRGRSPVARIATGIVALLCLGAVFATVSRGGIVALTAAMLASVVFAGPRRGRMAIAVVSVAVAALIYFVAFASDGQIERLTNSDGGTGRTDIWRIGWRMFEANPAEGIGSGNFSVSSIHYLLVEPGAIERDEFIVDVPAVAHNMYLGRLAETGIVGLGFFLSVLLIGLWTTVRAAGAFDRANEDGLSLIARAVAVGLIGTFAADFFLSAELSKLLWLLIGLGPAMLAMATRMESSSTGRPEAGAGV